MACWSAVHRQRFRLVDDHEQQAAALKTKATGTVVGRNATAAAVVSKLARGGARHKLCRTFNAQQLMERWKTPWRFEVGG